MRFPGGDNLLGHRLQPQSEDLYSKSSEIICRVRCSSSYSSIPAFFWAFNEFSLLIEMLWYQNCHIAQVQGLCSFYCEIYNQTWKIWISCLFILKFCRGQSITQTASFVQKKWDWNLSRISFESKFDAVRRSLLFSKYFLLFLKYF